MSTDNRLDQLRMRLAVAETVDEIDAVIGKSRQLLTKATDANDEALFDAAAYLVAVATRKGGKLLLSGHAAADFGPNKIAAWRRYAAMSHEEFCSEIEVAKMDARRRRQVRGGTSEAAAKTALLPVPFALQLRKWIGVDRTKFTPLRGGHGACRGSSHLPVLFFQPQEIRNAHLIRSLPTTKVAGLNERRNRR